MAHVIFDVDFAVLDPVGPVQVLRDADQAPAKYLGGVQSADEEIQDGLEPHLAAGRRRGIVDAETGHVHVLVALIHGQKKIVHP